MQLPTVFGPKEVVRAVLIAEEIKSKLAMLPDLMAPKHLRYLSSGKLELQFNPETLSLARSTDWGGGSTDDQKKKESPTNIDQQSVYPPLVFGGSGPETLSFTALFDTTMRAYPSVILEAAAQLASPITSLALSLNDSWRYKESVMDPIEALYFMTYPMVETDGTEAQKARPPMVEFQWADFSFFGVIESINTTILLADYDGRPVRATCAIQMKGALKHENLWTMPSTAAAVFDEPPPTVKTTKKKVY